MGVRILLKQSNPEHAHNSLMDPPDDLAAQDAALPRVDPLDDVFGSDAGDDPPFFDEHGDGLASQPHPSDMHRLQQEHTTAGYRDGVTAAKAGSVQAGFDEGFGLGATIGLKVGQLLGLLEGIASALASDRASAPAPEAAEAASLLADARAEMGARSVFSEAYWNADGTWKYEVAPGSSGEGEGEEETVLFSHVAEAHPLVKKWTVVVHEQMQRWGLQEQLPLLQRREDDREVVAAEPKGSAKATTQPQTEAKAPGGALSW